MEILRKFTCRCYWTWVRRIFPWLFFNRNDLCVYFLMFSCHRPLRKLKHKFMNLKLFKVTRTAKCHVKSYYTYCGSYFKKFQQRWRILKGRAYFFQLTMAEYPRAWKCFLLIWYHDVKIWRISDFFHQFLQKFTLAEHFHLSEIWVGKFWNYTLE